MAEVVSVKFKEGGRAYYFDPEQSQFTVGENVIVETSNGISMGTISKSRHTVADESVVMPLKKIIRRADEKKESKKTHIKSAPKKFFNTNWI